MFEARGDKSWMLRVGGAQLDRREYEGLRGPRDVREMRRCEVGGVEVDRMVFA